MTKEFKLSEKMFILEDGSQNYEDEDVKEFIKKLEEDFNDYCFSADKYENIEIKRDLQEIIKKRAGNLK